MSDLISRESLKQRINLNYNIHQYIDIQSIEDIINTEPSVEDKTVEELEKIRKEIENDQEQMVNEKDFGKYYGMGWTIRIIDNHIEELKGENK